jgi:hypothetical protein
MLHLRRGVIGRCRLFVVTLSDDFAQTHLRETVGRGSNLDPGRQSLLYMHDVPTNCLLERAGSDDLGMWVRNYHRIGCAQRHDRLGEIRPIDNRFNSLATSRERRDGQLQVGGLRIVSHQLANLSGGSFFSTESLACSHKISFRNTNSFFRIGNCMTDSLCLAPVLSKD